jgi:hypothetical protein
MACSVGLLAGVPMTVGVSEMRLVPSEIVARAVGVSDALID